MSDTLRVVRLNNFTPKRFSTLATFLLICAPDVFNLAAAAVKLPVLATAQNSTIPSHVIVYTFTDSRFLAWRYGDKHSLEDAV